ncbi:MAG TPA: 6-bladed beta-propeller [Steroidobacteraceae bacterium]
MPLSSGVPRILVAGISSLAVLVQDPPGRTAAVDLTIGGIEAREDYSFVAISGLAFAPDGRIIVTDLRDHVVRMYENSGAFVYSIGRQGAGPGEFTFPIAATIDHEGLLWVRDDGNRRFNAYELGPTRATFQTSVRYDHAPGVNRVEPIGFDGDGRIVSIGAIYGPGRTSKPACFHIGRDGKVVRVDTIRTPAADSIGDRSVLTRATTPGVSVPSTVYYYQPFGPTFLVAHSLNGEWARVVTSRYDVEWFSWDARRLRAIRQSAEGPPLSDAERERGQKSIDEFLARARVPASSIPGLPRRKTPVLRIAFDSDGNLWVERSVRDGEPREADVYDREGRRLAAVRWPREVDLLGRQLVATSGSHVLGVASDSLGVQRVVRLRWR